MQATIQKSGDSRAVLIPNAVAEQVGIVPCSLVDIEVGAETLHVRLVAAPTLDSLLAAVTEDNRHAEAW